MKNKKSLPIISVISLALGGFLSSKFEAVSLFSDLFFNAFVKVLLFIIPFTLIVVIAKSVRQLILEEVAQKLVSTIFSFYALVALLAGIFAVVILTIINPSLWNTASTLGSMRSVLRSISPFEVHIWFAYFGVIVGGVSIYHQLLAVFIDLAYQKVEVAVKFILSFYPILWYIDLPFPQSFFQVFPVVTKCC